MANNNIVLIGGKSATGKSASLRNLPNPEGVIYLNTESNKALPFKSKFQEYTVVDPLQVYNAFTKAEDVPDVHTIILDSLTYLMDQFESQYVLVADNPMKAWGDYAQFFKVLMQKYVANSSKNIIFTAHTADVFNEREMVMENLVKVKGSIMNNGIESYFSQVIGTKKVLLKQLTKYENKHLTILPEEETMGVKYVIQTCLTKESVNERIRAPLGMWNQNESFINNDIQLVLDRIHQYYA